MRVLPSPWLSACTTLVPCALFIEIALIGFCPSINILLLLVAGSACCLSSTLGLLLVLASLQYDWSPNQLRWAWSITTLTMSWSAGLWFVALRDLCVDVANFCPGSRACGMLYVVTLLGWFVTAIYGIEIAVIHGYWRKCLGSTDKEYRIA